MGPDHANLVDRATSGDPAAVDGLLERHLPALLAYLRLRADPVIRAHESCADVAQSICREVLEEIESLDYRGEAAFRGWLLKRAMAKLVNRKRHYLAEKRGGGRVRPLATTSGDPALARLYARVASPSEGAIARETAGRLERAFDRLSSDHREVVTMARVIGMSHAEIAVELGRSEGAVRVLLHRAIARLGVLMREDASAGSGE